jgi:hypothetical protein
MKKTIAQIRREAIASLVSLAKKHRLLINPSDYRNSKTNLPFRCLVCGYEGSTSLGLLKIKRYGCRGCGLRSGASKQKLNPEEIVEEARNSGIQITLLDYINTKQKVECRCSVCAHCWTTAIGCIRSGRGCPKCRRKQATEKNSLSETDVKKRLNRLGVELLSPYQNSQKKIKVHFRKCGHSVVTTWNQIQRGSGCAECAPNKKFVLEDYEAAARKFGGKIIKMPATVEKMAQWECSEGHRFSRSIRPMLRFGSFCTKCNDGWGESLCRMILEMAFGKSFDRIRPQDLRSPKGNPIELDCFNADLAIALEHQGVHHFKRQKNWQSEQQFKLCKEHDRLKRMYCKKNGILLIAIKEVGSMTSPDELIESIAQQIEKSGRNVPKKIRKINVMALKVVSRRSQYIIDVSKSAKGLNLELLETPRLADQKILVRCKEGHETLKTSRLITNGFGCSICYKNKLKKGVSLSDGRVFKSGVDAARALGVSKNVVNAAIRRGGKVKGVGVDRI